MPLHHFLQNQPYRRGLTKLLSSSAALWLVAGSLVPGLTFVVAHAEDFIIDTDVTITNGGETIDGDDSLTGIETGSISTTDVPGIKAVGGNNIVTNRSSIITDGDGGTGFRAYGIEARGGNSRVTNWGRITTSGLRARGILALDGNNTVTNWGTITTIENGARGISVHKEHNTITNWGGITTFGENASGILAEDGNNTVTNWGSIATFGADVRGLVVSEGNNTVTNGGKVVSVQSNAIQFHGSGNTLNLLAPGYLGGGIWLGKGTQVNLKTGSSHSVLWDLSHVGLTGTPSISGPVTGFYNETTKQFATFDPTVLAGTVNQLGHMQGQLSGVARHGLRHGLKEELADRAAGGDTDSATFGHPQGLLPGDGSIWATGFGGTYDHDGDASTLARDIEQKGGAVGYSWSAHYNLQLSAMAGYLWGSQQAESRWVESYSLDTNGAFAGLHGSTSLGMFAFDFGAVGGRLTHDSDRFVNDNLAPLGVSWATASYDSWFFNPEVGVSTAIDVARVTITPALRLAYAQQWIDSYSETGSKANSSVGAQSLGLLTASAEIKIENQISENASLHVTGGYLCRKNMGDETANIQLLGISNAVGFGDADSNAVTLGGGLSFNVGAHASIGATITTFFGDTFTGTQGLATVKIRF